MKKGPAKSKYMISILIDNEVYKIRLALTIVEKEVCRLVVIGDNCSVLRNNTYENPKKAKTFFAGNFKPKKDAQKTGPVWSSLYNPKDLCVEDRIEFMLNELNEGAEYINFMPLELPTPRVMNEMDEKLKLGIENGEAGTSVNVITIETLRRDFFHLTNHVYFFLEHAFILPYSGNDFSHFRLVVIHADVVWTDQVYNTLYAAKQAFSINYKRRSWNKNVTPIWSNFYRENLETVLRMIHRTYQNQKINPRLINKMRETRKKNLKKQGVDWIPYAVFSRLLVLSKKVSRSMS